jgi:hypothetical protein
VVGTVGLLGAPALGRFARRAFVLTAACAAVACLAGPLAYTAQTVSSAHSGSLPSAGPTLAQTAGRLGGFAGGAGGAGGGPGAAGRGALGRGGGSGHPGAPGSSAGAGTSSLFGGASTATRSRAGAAGNAFARGGAGGAGGTSVSSALASALEANAGHYRWVAATEGSTSAASLELATGGKPVMAIGGFNNNGGLLTLAQFEHYVSQGAIHYYIVSGNGGIGAGPGQAGGSSTSAITSWVESHYSAQTIGGSTVYDLAR